MRRAPLALTGVALLLATSCSPPVGARRVDARRVHRQLTGNVLTTGDLSRWSVNLLYDRDLVERYDRDPAGALADLHAALVAGKLLPDEEASLAELAFRHAEHGGGKPYYLAAALYAWAYLFPEDARDLPPRSDPRVRLAFDLYNRGVTAGFASDDGRRVEPRGGTFVLPFGSLEVTLDGDSLHLEHYRLDDFVPTAELEVWGFPTVYRWPGLGAPLAAAVTPAGPLEGYRLLAPRARVPVTAVLQPTDLSRGLRDGRVRGTLTVHSGYGERAVTIEGTPVPLETEPTAALALQLTDAPIWQLETRGFLHGFGVVKDETRLAALEPYRPGRIPVVFVHGTASSAARWAQLYNELVNDPRIRDRYQFWFFSYETGNPIAYSAMLLREALERTVAQLDPAGQDPALHRMVVIGHSQGGLLTKAQVVEPGTRFWDNVSSRPIGELRARAETRALIERAFFFHPLPFVQRVIFIATPHHGSYVAGSWLAHQVARLVRAPMDLTGALADVALGNPEERAMARIQGVPTSVDNMTPGNRFVRTLADLPVVPGVHAHSIIAVQGDGPPEHGADGVVAYESAHIEGVDSELVVRSGHSCQSNPHTIEEVLRILLVHLEQ